MALVNTRSRAIVLAAINALYNGTDPLSNGFLVDHNITADECFDLADRLALGAELLLAVDTLARGTQTERQMAARLLAQAVREE